MFGPGECLVDVISVTNASGVILECSDSTLMSVRVIPCSWILIGSHQVRELWQASDLCGISSEVRSVRGEYSKERILNCWT